jgi:hypothetical protein
MALVDKLYGVSAGGYINFFGVPMPELAGNPNIGQIITHVGKDLRNELMALPKGTKVGIEYPKELCYGGKATRTCMIISTKKAEIPSATRMYWNEILNICQMKGLDVVFLDDYITIKDQLQKLVEVGKKQGKINMMMINEKKLNEETLKQKVRKLNEEVYRLQTEASFIHIIKREEKVLERIIVEMPKVVIASIGNADYFMAEREMMLKNGINFKDHAREEFDTKLDIDRLPEYMKRAPESFGKLVQKPGPTIEALAERESIIRKMNALKTGRILPDKHESPRYIGTWDMVIPARGLFEVYVEHDMITLHDATAISGIIEDTFGTATFWGSVGNDSIRFEKTYDYGAVTTGGNTGSIRYDVEKNGERINKDIMVGEFDMKGKKSKFYMGEFRPGDTNLDRLRPRKSP